MNISRQLRLKISLPISHKAEGSCITLLMLLPCWAAYVLNSLRNALCFGQFEMAFAEPTEREGNLTTRLSGGSKRSRKLVPEPKDGNCERAP